MAHHRIAQIHGPWIGSLYPAHATEDGLPLLGTAQITGEHTIAVTQFANRRNPFYQCRNLLRRQHFSGPLAILSVIGKLHRVERPDVDPNALHGKYRGTVTGMPENHMRLNSKQVRRTFHAKVLKQLGEKSGGQYGAKYSLYDRPA
ncbi:hypothetical protein D3C76_732920 [compost metagenome]